MIAGRCCSRLLPLQRDEQLLRLLHLRLLLGIQLPFSVSLEHLRHHRLQLLHRPRLPGRWRRATWRSGSARLLLLLLLWRLRLLRRLLRRLLLAGVLLRLARGGVWLRPARWRDGRRRLRVRYAGCGRRRVRVVLLLRLLWMLLLLLLLLLRAAG